MQLIDVILAWLVAEDDGAKQKITTLLSDRDEDLSLLRKTLQGRHSTALTSTVLETDFSQNKLRA